jgi:hypothetical protein
MSRCTGMIALDAANERERLAAPCRALAFCRSQFE